MKIKRYSPNFHSGNEEEEINCSSYEEFVNIKWIKLWKEDADFYRFSFSKSPRKSHIILAELKGGTDWCVVALSEEIIDWLPIFSVNEI